MEDWQQRVIDEKEELLEKLLKLGRFIASDKFDSLPDNKASLMIRQSSVMRKYVDVLSKRIELFE